MNRYFQSVTLSMFKKVYVNNLKMHLVKIRPLSFKRGNTEKRMMRNKNISRFGGVAEYRDTMIKSKDCMPCITKIQEGQVKDRRSNLSNKVKKEEESEFK